jgi:hypothetical protein
MIGRTSRILAYPIPAQARWPLLWSMLIPTVLLWLWIRRLDTPLKTSVARGIVSLELAGNSGRTRAILASWNRGARRAALHSLWVDFPFIVAYSTSLGLGCALAAGTLHARGWHLAGLGLPLAWAQWGAGIADVVEDMALLRVLRGEVESGWPALARRAALLKFSLVALGFVYTLYGLLAGSTARNGPRTSTH